MYKKFEMELAGRTLRVDVGRVAKQANGAALMHYGDTVVLSTATASEKPRDGIDFFPLSVEYEEKMYSVGKIPGGFNKREGKASENAILTSRVIDRPMRPLFPKDYRNDVTLENLVLSVDQDCSPELTAMLGAALALGVTSYCFTILNPFAAWVMRIKIEGGELEALTAVDTVIPKFVAVFANPYIGGLLIAGTLSAIMSTSAALLITVSSTFTNDLCVKMLHKDLSGKKHMDIEIL